MGEIDYLVATTHPSVCMSELKASYASTHKSIQWLGLKVVKTFQGRETDKTGKVTFEASYVQKGRRAVHKEVSRFKRHAGSWYYLDGVVEDMSID